MEPDCPESPELVAITEFMPMSRPCMSTSGPPELPGLMAASVCTASISDDSPPSPPEARTGRLRAEMIPLVTVALNPSGEPMATTCWPTCNSSELPKLITGRFDAFRSLITAMSVEPSPATKSALYSLPSFSSTVISPPCWALLTTWLLVKMLPSSEIIEPDPSSTE